LSDFEQSESLVIDERSCDFEEDRMRLGETIESYRDDLEKLLRD
jgi:hypothetical protein